MFRSLATSALFALFAGTTAAQQLDIQREYDLNGITKRLQDNVCLLAFSEHIAPEFDGFETVTAAWVDIIEIKAGFLAQYFNTQFSGAHGATDGTITCVLAADGLTVTDIAVFFSGRGMPGFKRHPVMQTGGDPENAPIGSFSSRIEN